MSTKKRLFTDSGVNLREVARKFEEAFSKELSAMQELNESEEEQSEELENEY